MPIHLEGRRKELESIWQENLHKNGDDPHKSLEICIKALEEYPYDESFLFRAAIAEEWLADAETDDISKYKHLRKAMDYAQRLLRENPNAETAKELIVRIYSKQGFEDMAIEQAYKCQNVDLALKFCLKGDSLRRHKQQIISKKLLDLLYEMSEYETLQADFNLLDVSEKIVNIVIPDGNYQYFYPILEGIYLKRAGLYLQKDDEKTAIETLKKLFEITKSTADISRNQKHFTAPLFDLLEDHTPRFCELTGYVELFLISMEREFASLENNEEFAKIIDDANAYVAQFGKSSVQKRKDEMK